MAAATGFEDEKKPGEVKLWDLESKTERGVVAHKKWVACVAFSKDGTTFVSASADEITVWAVSDVKKTH